MFLLPIFATILLSIIIYDKEKNFIKSMALTWLSYTVISWLSIELLGWFYLWNKVTMSIVWIVIIAVCGYRIYRHKLWMPLIADINNSYIKQCVKRHKFVAGVTLVFVGLIFVLDLVRSPNNVDSMIYHLARIMHWIQEQSARPYAAGSDLQIRYPALSEYMIAQIAVLGAHDRLFNLFQAIGYFLSGAMIYGIGRRLRVSRKISFFSVWIYWMIPMAMAQSFTTQTDDIAGTFLLIYIYFLLDFIQADKLQADKKGLLEGVRLAVCVMMGYLCKPTITFAMVVFFLWMCIIRILRKDSITVLLRYVAVGALTAFLLYVPSLAKSYDTYVVQPQRVAEEASDTEVTQLTDTGMAQAANTLAPDSFNVTGALSNPAEFIITCARNSIRNTFSAYFPQWNDFGVRLVNKLGNKLHYDEKSLKRYGIQEGMNFWACDYASAPALMFICAFMGICFITRFSRTNHQQSAFVFCAIVSFFVQCALMGYTPFRSRYLVGVMALLAISIGIVLDNLRIRERSRLNIGIWLLALCSLGGLNTFYLNVTLTVDGFKGESIHKYFMGNPLPEEGNQAVIDVINANNFTTIAINGSYTYEYVLWKKISGLQRLESVNLTNAYKVYEDMSYIPECIIWETGTEEEQTKTLECHGVTYEQVWGYPGYGKFFGLYKPQE